MTQITQEKPVLTYNNKQYVIEELPNEARVCLVYMQEIDAKINELNKELTKEQIAKQGFEQLLGQYIQKMEEEKEQPDEQADVSEEPAN